MTADTDFSQDDAPYAPVQPANTPRKILVASLIGTTIEFYDFYIFATAAAQGPVAVSYESAPSAVLRQDET